MRLVELRDHAGRRLQRSLRRGGGRQRQRLCRRYGNNAVKEMPAGCASSSCVTTLGGGFAHPSGVAVDGSGNVYVADSATAR